MKRTLPVETKTAASGAIGAIITLVLLLNGWQHWFTAPPADVTAAITAAVSTLAGYFAPHTHVVANPKLSELVKWAHDVGAEVVVAAHPAEPATQPPATTTGGAS